MTALDGYAEELTGQCDIAGPVGVGKQTVVTDAMSAKIAIAIVRNRPLCASYTRFLPKELFTTIRNCST
jgi:hypothetical protein